MACSQEHICIDESARTDPELLSIEFNDQHAHVGVAFAIRFTVCDCISHRDNEQ